MTISVLAMMLLAALPDLGAVPSGGVRLYLVRHTEAYVNLEPAPKMDPEAMDALTSKGRAHAEQVAAALRGQPIAAILHSPVVRIRQTAEILRTVVDAPLRAEPRLGRIELGTTAAGTPLELSERVQIWQLGRDTRPKNGESMADVGERVVALMRSLQKSQPGTALVGVTHSEVVGSFLGHLAGTPGAERYPPRVPLGSITVVELDEDGGFTLLVSKREP